MELSNDQKMEILNRMKAHPMLENLQSRVKGCIFGPNGAGKTVAAVGLARKLIGPDKLIVFVDYTEGYDSLRNHKGLIPNVLPIPYESMEQLYVIAESVYRNIPPFVNVGAIIFDDMDFMTASELTLLWHKRVKENPGSKSDKDKPDRPEYLKLTFRVSEILDFIIKQTPNVHLLITAHDYKMKAKDSDVVIGVIPGFNPALAKEIVGKLQMAVHMTAKEVRRQDEKAEYVRSVQVHPTALIDCKTRVGCDKLRYEIGEFVNHVAEWSLQGRPEDSEAEALRRDIETSKLMTENDEFFGQTLVDDDDAPLVVA